MMTVVGVMGSGEGASARDVALAEDLGEELARAGWVVLTGGRPFGVMQAAVRGAKRVPGAITIGVLPGADGPVADGIDIPIFTTMGEARNVINVLSSRVVITCGALSPGTLSEAALALKLRRPLVLLAPPSAAESFLRTLRADLAVVTTASDAVAAARIHMQ